MRARVCTQDRADDHIFEVSPTVFLTSSGDADWGGDTDARNVTMAMAGCMFVECQKPSLPLLTPRSVLLRW